MAARFEYEINSRDKSKVGVDSAKKNLDGLGEASKKIGNVMKLAFAGVSLAAVGKQVVSSIKLFGEQEKSLIRLQAAVRNNHMLNGQSVKSLTDYASALQKVSIFGDEQIIQQQAILAGMGLTESQIKDTIKASVDLASTGMMNLESAVENLGRTYSGMAGTLGRTLPMIRGLTEEQLKSGAAIEIVKKNYEGVGEAVAKGVTGSWTQIKNQFGDLKETIGQTIIAIGPGLSQTLKPALDGIQEWFVNNQNTIINIFTNLPKIASISFLAVRDLLTKVFSFDFLKTIGSSLWKFFLEAGQSALSFLGSVLSAIGVTIWQPLKFGFETMVYNIKQFFAGFINFFVDKINFLIQQGQRVGLFKNTQALERSEGDAPAPEYDRGAVVDAWQNAGNVFKSSLSESLTAAIQLGENLAAPLEGVFDNFKAEFKEIIIQPVNLPGQGIPVAEMSKVFEGPLIAGMDILAGAMENRANPMADIFLKIGNVVGGFASNLVNTISSLAVFQQILDPVNIIIQGAMSILDPLINQVLQPLFGILTIVGMFIGTVLTPILQSLTPVIELVGEIFVWLYNKVFMPIGNFLIKLFSGVGLVIAGLMNGIIGLINLIPGVKIKLLDTTALRAPTLLEEITMSGPGGGGTAWSVAGAGASSMGSVTSGAGASYTAGRTINQTVNIYSDVIAGPGGLRDLAVMIRDEIYSAEALGA